MPNCEISIGKLVRIVKASSAADDRCRCEYIRSVKTLDDLKSELVNLAFNLSQSTTYFKSGFRNFAKGGGVVCVCVGGAICWPP